MPLFHYALKPGGFLFLGTSEGVGEFDDLFTVLDRKFKLYQRKESYHGGPREFFSRLATPPGAAPTATAKRRSVSLAKPACRSSYRCVS